MARGRGDRSDADLFRARRTDALAAKLDLSWTDEPHCTGIALCGVERKSRMDNWIEFKTLPLGMRHCAKCVKLGTI